MYTPKSSLSSRKLLLTSFTIIGAVSATIGYFLILPTANYHFQEVILNFYESRPTDFSVDVTNLVRGLGVVALACLGLGLLVGSVIGLSEAGKLFQSLHGSFARDTKIDAALLKSGLVTGIATHEGIRFDLTEKGRQLLQDYAENQRALDIDIVPAEA